MIKLQHTYNQMYWFIGMNQLIVINFAQNDCLLVMPWGECYL